MRSEPRVNQETLAGYVPINALPPDSLALLARKSAFWARIKGEFLFRAGEPLTTALFLAAGELQLEDERGLPLARIRNGDSAARHPLAHDSPRKLSAVCNSAVSCLAVDASLLDVLLTWNQAASACEVGEIVCGSGGADDDWMGRLLQSGVFRRLPPSNLQAMFLRLQKMQVSAGQTIIRQGDAGDYFYIIAAGRCSVLREQSLQTPPLPLAEFGPGACFGEEALISEAPRNATVTMSTDGTLMRLSKADFQSLLTEAVARKLGFDEAAAQVREGTAQWLDVRLPVEFQHRHLPGSLNLPLYLLRKKLPALPQARRYICVCDSGSRSRVAHFLLTQQGYDAWMLDGALPVR